VFRECAGAAEQELTMENVAPPSTTGAAGTSSGSGNAQLAQSFQQAIAEASATLSISVTGQAQLNALRARPN
jgi:hypothetical protein